MADVPKWDLVSIKRELIQARNEQADRCLKHSTKWLAELAFSLHDIRTDESLLLCVEPLSEDFVSDYDRYVVAKSYFDLKEFDHASFVLSTCTSDKGYFLYMYSRYMAGEKHKLDNSTEGTSGSFNNKNDLDDTDFLSDLRSELDLRQKQTGLDGYCLYLFGVVLRKLDLLEEAVKPLLESVNLIPMNWSAWLELASLIQDKDELSKLKLPDHWMKQFFLGHIHLEFQQNEEAMKIYSAISENGFSKSAYVKTQIAVQYHNIRDVDMAVNEFCEITELDPYRLEHMDTYSNLLYVKEKRAELAHLAHHCCNVDKYRVETCSVIGNYYSLRSQHDKAVVYFQRALKLNPNYMSAWTLMGHEYMEMKNSSAAIQAYRRAIEVNRRDYRAWYGLGQTYEILKMPYYCLYYYRQAQQLRPNDSRMAVALAEAYEKLDRLQEAKKCFWKAYCLGDAEGTALMRLAKLYEKLNEEEQAAVAYTKYINESQFQNLSCQEDMSSAYKYLADYYFKHERLAEAHLAATECTKFNETREDGKALLRQIANMRTNSETGDSAAMGSYSRVEPQRMILPGDDSIRLAPTNLTFD